MSFHSLFGGHVLLPFHRLAEASIVENLTIVAVDEDKMKLLLGKDNSDNGVIFLLQITGD
jgi:hypothetical protein